jgi:hypothetical protein
MFAIGMLSASLEETSVGWFRIKLGKLDQCIVLVAKPRHFGDHQWYFSCPVRGQPVHDEVTPSSFDRPVAVSAYRLS